MREQLADGKQALRELSRALAEMAAVPEGLTKNEREAAMIEPMGRFQLVAKFCEDLMRRNGWRRIEAK